MELLGRTATKHQNYLAGSFFRYFIVSLLLCFFASFSSAQMETATVSGVITDQSGMVVAGAEVTVVNTDTNATVVTKTNAAGVYVAHGLKPGHYLMHIAMNGFNEIDLTELTLNVQDDLSRNFKLRVGSTSQSISVEGNAGMIETSGSVSTVIDRQFAANLPLNGRSFNTLVQLTPGVTSTSDGFEINGQRSTTNYYVVDGVSANSGASLALNSVGSVPASTSLGGTNNLVSMDALQEFRVQTSSFAPEYGRTPGGQVEITTRSGTNSFHGNLFNYFRNNVLDSGDWFYNKAIGQAPSGTIIPRTQLRQNDFGGTFGGPILQDRTFFFLSYEGLRLTQPQVQVLAVPNLQTRQLIPAPLNQFVNAFPLPNGPDYGDGFATFVQTSSVRQDLDAGSIRVDHALNSKISLFGRVNFAPSEAKVPQLNSVQNNDFPTTMVTTGLNAQATANLAEQLRFNYSFSKARSNFGLSSLSGATIPDTSLLLPTPFNGTGQALFEITPPTFSHFASYTVGPGSDNSVSQFSLINNVALTMRRHTIKLGVDYRRLNLDNNPDNPFFNYFCTITSLESNNCNFFSTRVNTSAKFNLTNWSLYAQDDWRITHNLVVTYGLRWDINGAPEAADGVTFGIANNIDNPANLTITPGSRLWSTQYENFAPRLGIAFTPFRSNHVVFRGGVGKFSDLGTSTATGLGAYFPFTSTNNVGVVSIPNSNLGQYLEQPSFNPPYTSVVHLASSTLTAPYSVQWNVAAEVSSERVGSLALTYLGQSGRGLLRTENLSRPNPQISFAIVSANGSYSNYDALQMQFRRRLTHGLQAIANYTWSHSLDNQSSDAGSIPFSLYNLAHEYGNSSFDVRHNVSAALTYDLPAPFQTEFLRGVFGGWGIDSTFYDRTGLPINVTETDPNNLYLNIGESRPDYVSGQPFWISAPGAPDGKRINPAAFSFRSPSQQGSLPRNAVPGFGLFQLDTSLRRTFFLTERWKLLFRADAFNLLNHPNFANPNVTFNSSSMTNPSFGLSTQMLNQSLFGSPIYQTGGPRSLQLSIKIQF